MTEPDWTLAMATAWVAWRTLDAVRRVWKPFLQGCTAWERYEATLPSPYQPDNKVRVVGFSLVQPDVKAPDDVLLSAKTWTAMAKAAPAWCLDPPLIDADQAERVLRAALRAGDPLVARHGTMAEVIDRRVWGSLSLFDDGRGGPEDVHDRGGVVRFHRVRVERDAVLAVWSPMAISGLADLVPVSAPKQSRQRVFADFDRIRAAAMDPPMSDGLNRDEYHQELNVRCGCRVNRAIAYQLHLDPEVYPRRPGMGPHKAKSLGTNSLGMPNCQQLML